VPTLRLAELAEACGGTLLRGDPAATVDSYAIDTRRMQSGAAFFALRGNRTDGHAFLEEAAQRGAVVAVVERDVPAEEPAPAALIRVDDGSAALGRCGHWVRARLAELQWLAVTGSNGKTTTKELLAAGLSADRRVHRTPGNFNNQLGVPLTLLACPDDAQVAVLELAMSAHGEIAALTRMCDPDVGLVTNVRAAHLESLGSLDDIAAAKGELFAMLRDDAHVRVQATRHVGPRVTFGQAAEADVRLEDVRNRFVPGAEMTFRHGDRTYRLRLRIGGAHGAFDALAALAAVAAAGADLEAAIERMEQVEAGPGRGRVHFLSGGVVLVDDSYNSNPAALASVLDTLRLSEPEGRKVLVVGDMLELGPLRGAMHREAGKRAAAAGVHLLVAVGPESKATAEVARRSGVPETYHHTNSAQAAETVSELVRDGDLVVVKGSRGMHMERVVQALARQRESEIA